MFIFDTLESGAKLSPTWGCQPLRSSRTEKGFLRFTGEENLNQTLKLVLLTHRALTSDYLL